MLSNLLNKNFIVRSASGIVIVALLLAGTLYNELTNYVVYALIAFMCLKEMVTTLVPKDVTINKTRSLASGVLILVSYGLYSFEYIDLNIFLIITAIAVFARLVYEMFTENKTPSVNISYDIFSLIYTVVPILLLTTLPAKLVVGLLFIIWMNDVGAYVIGVLFGKHKLCKRLSPKKSIEGFVGGLITAVAVAYVLHIIYIKDVSVVMWCVTAVFVAIAGVLGDLFESMLKRSSEVKDSSNVIPGHGGFLDRFDALIFAAPVFWFIYTLTH